MTRRSFLLSAASAPLLVGAKNWEDRTDELLTNSPWSRPLTVAAKLDFVPGAQAAHTELYLTVRWSSALPVREALATGRSPVAPEPEDYLIEVFGIPATIASNRLAQFQKEFAKTARLSLTGHRTNSATSVHMPGIGTHVSAGFRFPRWEGVTGAEGTVEFLAEASGIRIRQTFKLEKMQYRGRLEL